jgi:hypothetical protein
MHVLLAILLIAVFVAALVGNRIAVVALAVLLALAASPFILLFATAMDSGPHHELLWLFPAMLWGLIVLGGWARNG